MELSAPTRRLMAATDPPWSQLEATGVVFENQAIEFPANVRHAIEFLPQERREALKPPTGRSFRDVWRVHCADREHLLVEYSLRDVQVVLAVGGGRWRLKSSRHGDVWGEAGDVTELPGNPFSAAATIGHHVASDRWLVEAVQAISFLNRDAQLVVAKPAKPYQLPQLGFVAERAVLVVDSLLGLCTWAAVMNGQRVRWSIAFESLSSSTAIASSSYRASGG